MKAILCSLVMLVAVLTPGAQCQQGTVNTASTHSLTISLSEQVWERMRGSAEKLLAAENLQPTDESLRLQTDEFQKIVRLLSESTSLLPPGAISFGVQGGPVIVTGPGTEPSGGWRRPSTLDECDCPLLRDSISSLKAEIVRLHEGD